MKETMDTHELQMKAYLAKNVAEMSDAGENMTETSGGNSAPSETSGRAVVRLPALPRFTDPGQKKAAGNILKFLALLLILTLVARGTAGATLAKVDVEAPARSEIVDAVTGSATVSARDTLDITAPEGLTVTEILVGTGHSVSVGDVIARFDPDEVQEEYIRAKANLEKQQLDLEKLLRADETDTSSLESAQRSLTRAQEDYESTKAQGEADIAAALKDFEEALAKTVDTPDSTSMNTAYKNYQRALSDYNTAKAQNDAGFAASLAAYNAAKAVEEEKRLAYEAITEDGLEKEAALAEYEAAKLVTAEKKAAYDADKKTADNLNVTAYRKVEDAWDSYLKAESDYNKSLDQSETSKASEIEKASAAYESAQTKAKDNLFSAARKVEDAEVSLEKAKRDYEKNLQSSADTAAQNSISAATAQLDIEKQKETVNKLHALIQNAYTLYSDVEGTVSSAVTEGSVTNANPLVSFMDSEKGFEASLQISKSDAEKLSVGDECEVTTGGGSMYYNPTVTSTISGISSPDENDKVTVTIRLPGSDWSGGQRVDVQAVQSRDIYDLCVPVSALHSDNSGYYLLTVAQKNTVLGVENIVSQVPVTVRAMDDDMAAVQGPIDRGSAVITGSSKSIEAGDRIRVNE